MLTLRALAAIVLLGVLTPGCEDEDEDEEWTSGEVTVWNDTSLPITVRYTPAAGYDGSVPVAPGEAVTIDVAVAFWDADIIVVHCSHEREYDLDFDVFGSTDDVHVRAADFPPCPGLRLSRVD